MLDRLRGALREKVRARCAGVRCESSASLRRKELHLHCHGTRGEALLARPAGRAQRTGSIAFNSPQCRDTAFDGWQNHGILALHASLRMKATRFSSYAIVLMKRRSFARLPLLCAG